MKRLSGRSWLGLVAVVGLIVLLAWLRQSGFRPAAGHNDGAESRRVEAAKAPATPAPEGRRPTADILAEVLATDGAATTGGRAGQLWRELAADPEAARGSIDQLLASPIEGQRVLGYFLLIRLYGYEPSMAEMIARETSPRAQGEAMRQLFLSGRFAEWEALVARLDTQDPAGHLALLMNATASETLPPIAALWGAGEDPAGTARAMLAMGGNMLAAVTRAVGDPATPTDKITGLVTKLAAANPVAAEGVLTSELERLSVDDPLAGVMVFELGRLAVQPASLEVLERMAATSGTVRAYAVKAAADLRARLQARETPLDRLARTIRLRFDGTPEEQATALRLSQYYIERAVALPPSASDPALLARIAAKWPTSAARDAAGRTLEANLRYLLWRTTRS